jgi:hypothetical protein
MKAVSALAVALAICCSAAEKRNWETGTLVEVTRTEPRSPGAVAVARNAPAAATTTVGGLAQASASAAQAASDATGDAMLAASMRPFVSEHLTVKGGGYTYLVTRVLAGRHPNLTVNGPVRYALQNRNFYILDEDNREFRLVVLEKRLYSGQPLPGAAGEAAWEALLTGDGIKEALVLEQMAHEDFQTLVPLMQIIGGVLRPDWTKMTTAEYLECLYVIAKYASFANQARARAASNNPTKEF